MLRLKRSRLSRLIAKVTAATLCLWVLPAVAPLQPAAAQAVITTAIVLDFQVADGLDASLGRRAADAVALELTNTGDYEVLPRQDVMNAIRTVFGRDQDEWNLTKAEQMRLGKDESLDVQRVVTGRVVSRQVSTNPAAASIQIAVIQRSMDSGEPINGAMVQGTASRTAAGGDPQVLVDEAINKAAASAVRTMQGFVLPVGMVLITARDKRIVINRGANQGVTPNMKFAVTRDRYNKERGRMEVEKVAEITIDTVDPEQSTGYATQTMKGIRSSDKVHAIYELPDAIRPGPIPLTERPKQVAKSGIWSKFGLPLAFVLGLASLVSTSGGDRGKVTAPPKQTTAQTGVEPSTTLVTFSNPSDLTQTSKVAYLVYRSTFAGFTPDITTLVDVIPGAQPQYVDTANWYDVDASISIDENTGQISTFDITKDPVTTPSPTRQALGQNMGDTFDIVTVHTPLQSGQQYYYKIARLTTASPPVLPTTGSTQGGGGGGGQQNQVGYQLYLSDASALAGPATPLAPATLVSPPNSPSAGSDTVDLGNVTFEWLAVTLSQGTAEYIIQVSDDSRFPTGRVWRSDLDEGVTIQTSAPQGTRVSRTFTTLDNFAPFANKSTFFWRVGVRNLSDALAPVEGYLYNRTPFAFSTIQPPPPPPNSARVFRAPRSLIQKPASGASPAPVQRRR